MTLYIVDGFNFIFRAFHSLPPLTRHDGMQVGAVYGFINMILKLMEKYSLHYDKAKNKQDMFVITLDSGHKNIRHELYPDYKANRLRPDEALIAQFPMVEEAIEAFGIPYIKAPKSYEADDVIASYAQAARNMGQDVVIISGDKDLMQLISEPDVAPSILMYNPGKDVVVDKNHVIEKFGINPNQVRDYLALIGDQSDNIPGVQGIGPKTATTLLSKYGSLHNIYDSIDKVGTDRIRKLLIEHKASADLSYKLVDLLIIEELPMQLEELKLKSADYKGLIKFAEANGFNSLKKRLACYMEQGTLFDFSEMTTAPIITNDSIKVLSYTDIELKNPQFFGIFAENGLLSFATPEKSYIIDTDPADPENKDLRLALEYFIGILKDRSIRKITINSKVLFKIILSFTDLTMDIASTFEDLSIMHYATMAGRDRCSKEDLARCYMAGVAPTDASSLIDLYHRLNTECIKSGSMRLYQEIDKPLAFVLAKMEVRGVFVDKTKLEELTAEFGKHVEHLSKVIYDKTGQEFNIGSPKQLGYILFEKMKLPYKGKKNKTGAHVTGADILEGLSEMGYDIADDILNWRQFSKFISTYTRSLAESINPATGRVHSSFNQTLTTTARLSSSAPNLQNIPVRVEEGQKIRSAFAAKPGYKIISADYSQIELRILGHIADVTALKDAMKAGKDIHKVTASTIFEISEDEITPQLRRAAKAINFGIIYGLSAFGLAKMLGISKHQAEQYINSYFTKYSGIKRYMDETLTYARAHGFVKTISGRRCYIEYINDKNYGKRSFAERAAINAPIQGSASDIIRKAMVMLDPLCSEHLILQIHDELLFEVPEDMVDEFKARIKATMESAWKLDVPITASVNHGDNWHDAK